MNTSRVTPLRERDVDRIPAPPADSEIEQSLIGSILVQNNAYSRVADFLRPEHFASAVHARIYAAAGTLIERGEPANPVTLKQLFDQDGALAEIGGAAYLARLAESAVTIINAPYYARTILDLFLRRQLIEIGQELVADAYRADLDNTAAVQIDAVEAKLMDLAKSGISERRDWTIGAAARRSIEDTEAAYKRDGKIAGLSTGLIDLDQKTGGLAPGDLIIIGGRPSAGKTAMAIGIAEYMATRGEPAPVGFCEIEQTAPQLAQRVLGFRADVAVSKQRRGDLDQVDWGHLTRVTEQLQTMPIYIDDRPALTLAQIRWRARQWRNRHGIQALIVDHLQLSGAADDGRRDSRHRDLADFTAGMKNLAKELGIPVVLLSQLSRSVDQRDNKRPQLADLRDSGSIEENADIVIFLFREEYYLRQAEPSRRADEADDKFNDRYDRWRERCEATFGIAEAIIAKNRSGPLGTVKLHWDAGLMLFGNFIGPEYLPRGDY